MRLQVVVPLAIALAAAPALTREVLTAAALREAPAAGASRIDPEPYRDEGERGLERFLDDHAEEISRGDGEALRALDQVCAQYDCQRTHLYWHTDLEAAKAAARAQKKPILSLHLLGRFDEQLTCANSRFFRRILYPDPRVAELLRRQFVLHWRSVRPVPKVTIDFGDGRTVQRTLTGNSAHFVLDADGRPLDVLPGLFSPAPFAAALKDAAELSRVLRGRAPSDRAAILKTWHQARLAKIATEWARGIEAIGEDANVPTGLPAPVAFNMLDVATDEARWGKLASRLGEEHRFSERVRAGLLDEGFPTAERAAPIAVTKAVVENPVLGAVRRIERTVGRDSLQNQWRLHGRVHARFSSADRPDVLSVDGLNAWVYATLFLSPLDDPWYGLGMPDDMVPLDDGVIIVGSN